MDTIEIVAMIAKALSESEAGRQRHAAKRIAALTDCDERSVQHWMRGYCAPSIASFVALCRAIPEMKSLALELIEAEDVIDPEFERRLDGLVEAWLAHKGRAAA